MADSDNYLIAWVFSEKKKMREGTGTFLRWKGDLLWSSNPNYLYLYTFLNEYEMSIFSKGFNQNYLHNLYYRQLRYWIEWKEKLFSRIFLWPTRGSWELSGEENESWPFSHPLKCPCSIEAAVATCRQESNTVSLWRSPQAWPTLFTHTTKLSS